VAVRVWAAAVRVRAQATGAWEVAAKAMPRAAAARAGCVAAAARLWTETVKLRTMARTTVGRREHGRLQRRHSARPSNEILS
jgi:hypothetical protein